MSETGPRVPDHAGVDFERLFLGMPTAYLVMTPDLVIVDANEAYLALLGRTREELVGRYVFDAFPPPPDALDEHGRNPVAEGIETPGQLAAVRELGCHIGQGYLLARPAPASGLLRAAQDGATLLPSAGPAPRSSRSSKARRRPRAEVTQR